MRFGYRLNRLLGTVHGNGNVTFVAPEDTSVLSAVRNRVVWVDLVNHVSSALPFETRKDIKLLSASNDGRLLMTIDDEGRGMLVNLQRRVVLHRINFKQKVRAVAFSPNDRYIAVAVGKKVEVWKTPSTRHHFAPLALLKTYGGFGDDITCLDWAPDSLHFLAGSKDMSVRIFYVNDTSLDVGFLPTTLSGHRDIVRNAFFAGNGSECVTVAKDGGVFAWEFERDESRQTETTETSKKLLFSPTVGAWRLRSKHFLRPNTNSQVASAAFARAVGLLVVGFTSGVFGLYEMPSGDCVHTLSIGRHGITSAAIARGGEWLAFGCASVGQLLVWEWKSETYVLKQAGHSYGINTLAFSPNGALCVTGGEDNKVKLWSVTSGFCFVTFTEHEAPVSAVCFVPGGGAVLSASLDGTVRAHDTARYRCFRTLVTPQPAQLTALAVDPAGEVVVAGAADPFEMYVWSLQTGKILDVFGGHEAPLSEIAFSPTQPIVASASWDGTVKLWDIYKSELVETLEMPADVLAVAFRPDGKQICCACLNGTLQLYGVDEGDLQGIIEGRRDVAGGRRAGDKITAEANARSRFFTSVTYSADGECVLAGGESRHVCLYACASGVLVRKFQVSHNRSLDGILDKLNSSRQTEAGNLDLLEANSSGSEGDDRREDSRLPGAKRGNDGSRRAREAVRTTCVRFSLTGFEWAAATPDGVQLYSLDDTTTFVPLGLDEDVTPQSIRDTLVHREWAKALVMAVDLGEQPLLEESLDAVPLEEVELTARALPSSIVPIITTAVAKQMEKGNALEYRLVWLKALLQGHGKTLLVTAARNQSVRGALRTAHKAITSHEKELSRIVDENQFTLDFISMNRAADVTDIDDVGDQNADSDNMSIDEQHDNTTVEVHAHEDEHSNNVGQESEHIGYYMDVGGEEHTQKDTQEEDHMDVFIGDSLSVSAKKTPKGKKAGEGKSSHKKGSEKGVVEHVDIAQNEESLVDAVPSTNTKTPKKQAGEKSASKKSGKKGSEVEESEHVDVAETEDTLANTVPKSSAKTPKNKKSVGEVRDSQQVDLAAESVEAEQSSLAQAAPSTAKKTPKKRKSVGVISDSGSKEPQQVDLPVESDADAVGEETGVAEAVPSTSKKTPKKKRGANTTASKGSKEVQQVDVPAVAEGEKLPITLTKTPKKRGIQDSSDTLPVSESNVRKSARKRVGSVDAAETDVPSTANKSSKKHKIGQDGSNLGDREAAEEKDVTSSIVSSGRKDKVDRIEMLTTDDTVVPSTAKKSSKKSKNKQDTEPEVNVDMSHSEEMPVPSTSKKSSKKHKIDAEIEPQVDMHASDKGKPSGSTAKKRKNKQSTIEPVGREETLDTHASGKGKPSGSTDKGKPSGSTGKKRKNKQDTEAEVDLPVDTHASIESTSGDTESNTPRVRVSGRRKPASSTPTGINTENIVTGGEGEGRQTRARRGTKGAA